MIFFVFTKHIGQAIALFVVLLCVLFTSFFYIACDTFAQRREVNKELNCLIQLCEPFSNLKRTNLTFTSYFLASQIEGCYRSPLFLSMILATWFWSLSLRALMNSVYARSGFLMSMSSRHSFIASAEPFSLIREESR